MEHDRKPWYLKLLSKPAARAQIEAEGEERERWDERERHAADVSDRVSEENRALAHRFGFSSVGAYFEAMKGVDGDEILSIAVRFRCDWDRAKEILARQRDRERGQIEKVDRSLRKQPKYSSEGQHSRERLNKLDGKNIRRATRKRPPKKPPYNRKNGPTEREVLTDSRGWQNALEAKGLGIIVEKLIEMRLNTEEEDKNERYR